MPAYIGEIYLPNVAAMPESQEGNVEEMIGLGLNAPITNTHAPEPMKLVVQGYLFKKSGTVKTAEDYAEDIQALLRDASYNYLNFDSRVGYLELEGVPRLDRMGDNQLLIPYTIDAFFHPDSQFQRRLKSNPEILTNDFSIALGAGGADNYIPLPIGATYSGGDSSTITRAGKDGTVTLVKANTSKNINFDLAADEVNVGGCKVWDSVVAGDTNEANWIRVFSRDHVFTGDAIIENGFIRVKMKWGGSQGTGGTSFQVYSGGSYDSMFYGLDFKDCVPYVSSVYLRKGTPDEVALRGVLNFNSYTGSAPTYKATYFEIIIRRGSYLFEINTDTELNTANFTDCFSITSGRFAYIPFASGDKISDGVLIGATDNTAINGNDNYAIGINAAKDYFHLIIGVKNGAAHTDHIIVTTTPSIYSRTTNGSRRSALRGLIPFSSTANLFKECESMTQGSGVTYYTGADASPKTGNTGSTLNAQNEQVDYTQAASNLGHGATGNSTYKLFVRAKDSAQVANDLRIKVENTTDATILANVTKTLTAAWAYYSVDVTLSSTDATTDNIKVTLSKDTVTANVIDLDYVLWVPVTLDNGNGPQQIAHQALVNQRMKRDLALR